MTLKRKILSYFFLICLVGLVNSPLFAQSPDNDTVISIQNNRSTVFDILSEISRQTTYYFIYDSELIDNSREVSIRKGEYTLEELLGILFADKSVNMRYIENYIVIYPDDDKKDSISLSNKDNTTSESQLLVMGRIADASSGAPLPFASVVLPGRGKGISANEDGIFKFKIPSQYHDDTLKISHLGYAPRYLPVNLLQDMSSNIYLEFESKLLDEVTVTSFDPMQVLSEAIASKAELYPGEPTLHTSFYREGVFKNSDLLKYSEALFEIYKSSYGGIGADQVKVLKSRNISSSKTRDSVVIKLKAGIQGMLELDIVKHPPGFFDPLYLIEYQFPDACIVNHDEGSAYAITFKPAEYVDDGIYEGTMYIDTVSLALLEVDFNITAAYLALHQKHFLLRRSKSYHTRIQQMRYSVRYAWYNGNYHIQHVRGEIEMKVRQRNKLFGDKYSAFFEMAVMNIETEEVKRFARRETISPAVVFTDQNFSYDPDFWEDFNFIFPEVSITNALKQFRIPKVEYRERE